MKAYYFFTKRYVKIVRFRSEKIYFVLGLNSTCNGDLNKNFKFNTQL